MSPKKRKKRRCGGFTLIELLIVIVIIGVLALIVVLVLNPAEMLRKGRDSQRLSDMTTIKSAISLYLSDTTSPSMGTVGDVYCSHPVSGCPVTCNHCNDTPYNNDGTGWIPIDLTGVSSGTPISHYPADPTNSATGGQYYRYQSDANNSFEIDSVMESDYYTTTNDVAEKDGGNNIDRYELGTKLDLLGS